MKKVDMIVKAPFFYTMEGEGVGFKSDVAMVVDGSKIIDFVPLKDVDEMYQAEEVLNMDHHAVFPGLDVYKRQVRYGDAKRSRT